MEKYPQGAPDPKAAVEALKILEKNRTGIVLTGRVKDGKVVLDQSALEDIARRFPGADISFVAVNAPFDPKSTPLAEVS
jgi:hypothetical protein